MPSDGSKLSISARGSRVSFCLDRSLEQSTGDAAHARAIKDRRRIFQPSMKDAVSKGLVEQLEAKRT